MLVFHIGIEDTEDLEVYMRGELNSNRYIRSPNLGASSVRPATTSVDIVRSPFTCFDYVHSFTLIRTYESGKAAGEGSGIKIRAPLTMCVLLDDNSTPTMGTMARIGGVLALLEFASMLGFYKVIEVCI